MTSSYDFNNNHKTPPSGSTTAPTPITNYQPLPPSTPPIPLKDPTEDWSLATKDIIDTLPQVWTRGLLYLLAIFAGVILPWSMLAKVDETGEARGKLEPKGNTIDLDAPVTGKIAVINIKEGEPVKAGQVILELDSELVKADLQQVRQKLQGEINRLAQLEIQKNQWLMAVQTQGLQNQSQESEKLSQVDQAKQHLESLRASYGLQRAEKEAKIAQVKQAINASEASYRLAKVRLEMDQEKLPRYQRVFKEGAISEDRFLEVVASEKENTENLAKAESEIAQAQSGLLEQQGNYETISHEAASEIEQAVLRLQEQKRSYKTMVHSGKLALLKNQEQLKNVETEIMKIQSSIAENKSQITSLQLQLQQRVFRSPIDGTIFEMPTDEPGQVVQPGELVAQIAPKGVQLVLRAQMPSSESGFMKVGMPVKIKLDAYPFQEYGILEGRLDWVSPDSKVQEMKEGNLETYDIKVTFDKPYLETKGELIHLIPGQGATAEVIVRQRRVIDFVLDPFKKLQEGGLEL
ncbi:HlyD family efflux transporter periplasmic adaptor subunit [Crocosphaera sp. XPORK-15E]|uniref:HlyD family efflux transporter periplasmic adaptor subunit n=1 Tax=Crocosphaera sp. XPORK-15E TaxID=3110247 RepID=UPI002B21684A|nr:HlyD family efflux transporter periplasmic adaptor subunit [Crocosphaera sp. XPORK-15E]MEA5536362.1 HlyD family efflux transporter periplasmic adaptor subunit [Crocosphaera sp. XPORK-15E]